MTELGKFEFECPKCDTVHKRSFWSVAHIDVGAVVQLRVRPADLPERREVGQR